MDLLSLIPNVQIRLIQIFIEASDPALHRKMIAVDRAQQEGAQTFGPTEFKKLARMRQLADGVLHLLEAAVEPGFKLRQRDLRDKALVKAGERQAKLGAECFERDFFFLRLCQNVIGRLPYC